MSTSVSTPRISRAPLTSSRRPGAWRWGVAFVAVTALHGLGALWIAHHRNFAQPVPPEHVPVQIALLKPQHIERRASPPAAAAPARAPARAEHLAPHEAPRHTLKAIAHEAHPNAPAQPTASAPAASAPAAAPAGPAATAATGNGTGSGTDNTPAAPSGPASHGLKFSAPPSGDLQYDTFYNGMQNQPGTIRWNSDGQHYEMVVSVPLPFVGTFSWTSHGRIDPFGLAPDQYIEKRGHRPEDVTVFNRTGRQIVFTRTPNSLALPDGAQDRFSVVMQLASLVRGDPDAYKPGVTREFYVADNDSGETWPVTTIGDESVSTDHGFVDARHFMRLPRRDGDRRRIDVWLAPSLGWLPVRLVQTEPNGSQFELVWRGPLSVPSVSASAGSGVSDTATDTGAATAASPATSTTAPDAPASNPPALQAPSSGQPTDGAPSPVSPPAQPGALASPSPGVSQPELPVDPTLKP